ncbi:hypothetical protein MMC24_004771 [Lignoscripta atroalba]|nr:hypothetical protein [Lignoscripta atroalba]
MTSTPPQPTTAPPQKQQEQQQQKLQQQPPTRLELAQQELTATEQEIEHCKDKYTKHRNWYHLDQDQRDALLLSGEGSDGIFSVEDWEELAERDGGKMKKWTEKFLMLKQRKIALAQEIAGLLAP